LLLEICPSHPVSISFTFVTRHLKQSQKHGTSSSRWWFECRHSATTGAGRETWNQSVIVQYAHPGMSISPAPTLFQILILILRALPSSPQ
jgi:hypothetical protein